MELGHLLACSSLIHPGISSVVFPGSFCHLFLLSRVICYEAFHLYVASSFVCSPIFSPRLVLYLIPLQSLRCFIICQSVSCCFPHIYFVSSSIIILVSVALKAQSVSVWQAEAACHTDTTPTQPHRNSNTHRNKSTRPMW